MKILCLGDKKKFINDITNHRDSIIDLYNDGLYLKDSKDYTDGYLSGAQFILHKMGYYEEKEIKKILKGLKHDV